MNSPHIHHAREPASQRRGLPAADETWRNLVRHKSSSERSIDSVSARCAARGPGEFEIKYRVLGDVTKLNIAAPGAGARKEGLWRTTCFELFARFPGRPSYWEVNLSPSSDWAVYRFGDYRSARCDETNAAATNIAYRRGRRIFELKAQLRLPVATNANAPSLTIGLSAILEDEAGLKSYWALAHPAGAPDFHNPSCFTFALQMERKI